MTSAQPDPKTGIVTREEEPGGSMTFFEHLTELRKRIINSLISIVIGSFVGFYLSGYFVEFITKPMARALADAHLDPKLIYTHPAGFLNLLLTLVAGSKASPCPPGSGPNQYRCSEDACST